MSGQVSFAPSAEFGTGWGPVTIATGDLDGDGKPDVVVANFEQGRGATVSVLRNTSAGGSISFAPKVDVPTGTGPYGVALGDLDGDGKLEIAVANFGSLSAGDGATVSVLRNVSTAGSVSFAPKVDVATGIGPRDVAIGDLDGDGKLDLMVANYGPSGSGTTASALRNTSTAGAIAFAPKVDFATGQGGMTVAIRDVDGDGRRDVLVANYGNGIGDTVALLTNATIGGNLSFAPRVELQVGVGPHGIALDDVDGDGWLDLAAADYGSLEGSGTTVSVLRAVGFRRQAESSRRTP
jgi:hypothetical protein